MVPNVFLNFDSIFHFLLFQKFLLKLAAQSIQQSYEHMELNVAVGKFNGLKVREHLSLGPFGLKSHLSNIHQLGK